MATILVESKNSFCGIKINIIAKNRCLSESLFFFKFLNKTNIVGTHLKFLNEMLPVRTATHICWRNMNSIIFGKEIHFSFVEELP